MHPASIKILSTTHTTNLVLILSWLDYPSRKDIAAEEKEFQHRRTPAVVTPPHAKPHADLSLPGIIGLAPGRHPETARPSPNYTASIPPGLPSGQTPALQSGVRGDFWGTWGKWIVLRNTTHGVNLSEMGSWIRRGTEVYLRRYPRLLSIRVGQSMSSSIQMESLSIHGPTYI